MEKKNSDAIYVEGSVIEDGERAVSHPVDKLGEAAHVVRGIARKAKGGFIDVAIPTAQNAAILAADGMKEKVVPFAQEKMAYVQGRVGDAVIEAKTRYYNPVFAGDFASGDFRFPKMIEIVDPADKSPFLLEQGACGHISNEADMQVLHLFDGEIPQCDIQFYPRLLCGSVYFVDVMNPHRYIDLSKYYSIIQAEREAELKSIAYDLGAKRCSLEYNEEEIRIQSKKGSIKAGAKNPPKKMQAHVDACAEESGSSHGKRRASFVETFEGNPKVQAPSLYWYRDDPYIKQLIRSRCAQDGSKTKHYECKIDQASSSTLDVTTATKIDAALDKMGLSANASFKGMAKEEMRKEFRLVIDF